ncbi:MAG: dihydrofolate reductase [Planctomycetota bacterium]|nr:dihydrofolate reductase [Planctomycetota bacterium]MCX8040438.1 dihydrofolate reductase [Planctomycetota bacterium]MDW8373186.1 dihydrofolate reductase [Planctomycetota bacterium]
MTRPAFPPLAIVVAYSVPGRVIGDGRRLLWHHPADLRRFRELTWGHAVVMGRRTWESLGRPLPGRRNLVLSRQPAYQAAGAEVFAELSAALAAARAGGDPCPMVIGGGSVYAEALPLASDLYITEVHERHDGAVRFPELDAESWQELSCEPRGVLVFRHWRRLSAAPAPGG